MADLKKWLQNSPRIKLRPKDEKIEDEPKELHPDEKRALYKLQREARQAGATLHSDGKGGLPPSLVLGVMRRDKFTCKECGKKQDLQIHHLAGVVTSQKLSRMGHANRPEALGTICAACHNKVHTAAKKAGVDSSQVLPVGDVGTKHDKGQPIAQPSK